VTVFLIDLFPFRRDLLGQPGLLEGASLEGSSSDGQHRSR
jgi:hypothetical protein